MKEIEEYKKLKHCITSIVKLVVFVKFWEHRGAPT